MATSAMLSAPQTSSRRVSTLACVTFGSTLSTRRARIPSTSCAVAVDAEALRARGVEVETVGIAVDFERAVAYRRWSVGGAVVEFRWYCSRHRRSILVLEVEIDNSGGSSEVEVPVRGGVPFESNDIAFALVKDGLAVNATVYAGKVTRRENPYDLKEALQDVAVVYDEVPSSFRVGPGANVSLSFITAVRTSVDSDAPTTHAQKDYAEARAIADRDVPECNPANCGALVKCTDLIKEHEADWRTVWESRVEVGDNVVLGAQVNASLYAILSSTRADLPYPAGTAAVSNNNYWGHIFWDFFWYTAPLIHFDPDTARVAIDYYFARMDQAKAYAVKEGYKGCLFPWESAKTGHEVDLAPQLNILEVHSVSSIALFARRFWDSTHDTDWLSTRGYPVASCIADFWASRVTDNGDGSFSINKVVGPDEFGVGFPLYSGVDDNPYTNAAASIALTFAADAAAVLGVPGDARWSHIADNLRILYDAAGDWHPEYVGFPKGNTWFQGKVKQADVVLLGYPLEWPMTGNSRHNDLVKYEAMYDKDGPGMTWSMSAVGWLDLGNETVAHTRAARALLNLQKPFNVWTETPDPNVHPFDMGAWNFLTSAGGFTQVIVNGYGGLRIREDALYFRPTMPENTTRLVLRGIHYLGFVIDFDFSTDLSVRIDVRTTPARDASLCAEYLEAPSRLPWNERVPSEAPWSQPVRLTSAPTSLPAANGVRVLAC
eukprot:Opistho-1_new@5977